MSQLMYLKSLNFPILLSFIPYLVASHHVHIKLLCLDRYLPVAFHLRAYLAPRELSLHSNHAFKLNWKMTSEIRGRFVPSQQHLCGVI